MRNVSYKQFGNGTRARVFAVWTEIERALIRL